MALLPGPRALSLLLVLFAGPAAAAPGAEAARAELLAREVEELRQRLDLAEQRINALLWGLGMAGVAGLVVGRRLSRRSPRASADEGLPPTEQSAAPHAEPSSDAKPADASPSPAEPEPSALTTSAAAFISGTEAEESAGDEMEDAVDVDQQAEFLLVLGQDEAAIDLLLQHLRGTGGTSPLPYLRLMQIYRRREDAPAYERTRERFNQRFNAVAPEWGADTRQQRRLEAYPDVMAQLQQAWGRPLDARVLLETLLFRRGSDDERFDLAAYEELLFLHGLTRELLQCAERPPQQVDVMLPIDELQQEESVIQPVASPRAAESPFEATAVFTQVSVDRLSPTVDLDLSTRPSNPDQALDR